MKAIHIEVFDKYNHRLIRIVARKLDATQNLTIISLSDSLSEKYAIRWQKEIDHWNIFENMITIYYKDSSFVEVTKY